MTGAPLTPWRGSGAHDLAWGGTSLALLLRRTDAERAARPRWYHRLADYLDVRVVHPLSQLLGG